MRISEVRIHPITLPFAQHFSHSQKKDMSADNILLEIVGEDGGFRGYGEGAPRLYVTGESQAGAVKTAYNLVRSESFPWDSDSIAEIWKFIEGHREGRETNSALCSVEIALLDALGKSQSKPIIDYLPAGFYTGKVHYGATVPLGLEERITKICGIIKTLGLEHVRVKLGSVFIQNERSMRIVRSSLGDSCELRIDVNGAWDRDLAFKHLNLLSEHRVKVVEQPLMHGNKDLGGLAEELRARGINLMADESACTLRDVEEIIDQGFFNMVNVRLSKCGGFNRSLKIIDLLRKSDLSFQIGCQLGESGVLSAAGRSLCLVNSDAAYFDGSYDSFLLKENITTEDVTFGPGGVAGPLGGYGLGVKVDLRKLERLSRESERIIIKRP